MLREQPKIRYIRDWLNGSTSNTDNHWVEIQAIDYNGNNVALGKAATHSYLTDGNTASSPYYQGADSVLTSVQVDLGQEYLLKEIKVWHYYLDGRTYYNTKTEVSHNLLDWRVIFDSAIAGTYQETSAGKTHSLPTLSVKESVMATGISEVGITNGLVAYYPLNKDAKDYSGNGYHGTVTGATLTGGGYDGTGAYNFASSTDNIDIATRLYIPVEKTLSFWVKSNRPLSSTDNFEIGFVDQGSTSGSMFGMMYGVGQCQDLGFWGYGNPYDASVEDYANKWSSDGLWHHCVITMSSTRTVSIYVDGAQKQFKRHSDGVLIGQLTMPIDTTNYFIINSRGVWNTGFTYAQLSNVKIFNRALTAEEISVEYKRTGPTKMTQHNGTVYIQGQVKEL